MGGLGAGLPGLGGPGPGQIPPPPGGLGSGLLALGSVAGALVGHPYNQYGNQMKEDDTNKIVTKAKPMMAVKESDLAMWNSSTSDDYSDNGNELVENENISQISTPKIRDRF